MQNIETNFILSVYGKDEFELFFKDRITPEKIVFYDAEKGQKLERLAGIQFPDYYSSITPNIIIKQPACIDKIKNANEHSKDALSDKANEAKAACDAIGNAREKENIELSENAR